MAEKKGFTLTSIFNRHTLIHGALMLAMVFTPVAAMAASAGASVSLGDIAAGALDMAGAMLNGVVQAPGIITDVVGNGLQGVWALQSYQMGAHTLGHAAAAVHGGAAACTSVAGIAPGFQDWALNLQASGDLSGVLAQSQAAGSTILDTYAQNYCHPEGH